MANKKHAAGAFDIRNFIGLLIGIYGIVLVICSFVLDPGTNPDTGALKNSSDNLYAGIAMLAVGAFFMLWAKMKPIVVDETKIDESALPGGH
ncbi:hypothetical protein [Corynebacterium gerontici]|uniref:Cell wall anchor protein n=1 Tax=Corynebacterium gerontici TaxID=2079234 RepID=A0A3G6IZH4_9CORY|nr:hypothetical protein [Corynebacterium gerontici]AZA11191.1 hypothetical protein CGERO_04370 [Corynebacterium gerontici]